MGSQERSPLEWALTLAQLGFLIFPLKSGAKEPLLPDSWKSIMTMDEDAIREWFSENPNMNYGVCPGENHVLIDLDQKEEADGVETFSLLELENSEVDTLRVRSPSGGIHIYLATDNPASNAHRFPAGIDVRGAGGYVVGPGCRLIEGNCKPTDTPGYYEIDQDSDIANAPGWVAERLKAPVDKSKAKETKGEVDDPGAVERAREFLRHRDPAIEGLGGDHHTLVTAMCLMDFGVSEPMALDLLVEPHVRDDEPEEDAKSWNDRCVPPWDIFGRKGTLEEKVKNAKRYREKEVGAKGGGSPEEIFGGAFSEAKDIEEMEKEDKEKRFSRFKKHTFRGDNLFKRNKRREFVIPEWLPAHGMVANLARRGGGKTVVMLDMALRIASDREWYELPVKEDFYSIYICGEDDEGAEEQIRAWCKHHEMESLPERFIFLDIITDLMSAEDTREWAEYLKSVVGKKRAVVFLDTWQRASAKGGQNKDEDMQLAVHHAEALARSLNGPAVVAFHPPKHDASMVMGSSVIENSTTAIWNMTDLHAGRKLEVTRIKGKGVGNYHLFKFHEVSLGEEDEFGNERTGIVPIRMGGAEGNVVNDEADESAKVALAQVLRDLEIRRKDDDPESKKHYASSNVAKLIHKKLPQMQLEGDEWATEMMVSLNEAGVNINHWQRINERIIALFGSDSAGYDFADGYVLKVYRDGNSRRVKLERGGIGA